MLNNEWNWKIRYPNRVKYFNVRDEVLPIWTNEDVFLDDIENVWDRIKISDAHFEGEEVASEAHSEINDQVTNCEKQILFQIHFLKY